MTPPPPITGPTLLSFAQAPAIARPALFSVARPPKIAGPALLSFARAPQIVAHAHASEARRPPIVALARFFDPLLPSNDSGVRAFEAGPRPCAVTLPRIDSCRFAHHPILALRGELLLSLDPRPDACARGGPAIDARGRAIGGRRLVGARAAAAREVKRPVLDRGAPARGWPPSIRDGDALRCDRELLLSDRRLLFSDRERLFSVGGTHLGRASAPLSAATIGSSKRSRRSQEMSRYRGRMPRSSIELCRPDGVTMT